MEPSLKALVRRLEQLSDQFAELREGVRKAVLVAEVDPEMALTRARKVLEYVVRDVYVRRCNEPPGTRPLENLLQRLVKDGHFPDRLDAYANTIRKLGNVGTHSFGEKVTVADVYQSLTALMPILEWYFETERPEAVDGPFSPPAAPDTPASAPVPPANPEPRRAVVPKGLRSFDARDADFFLDLLPGPRDRDGLPESLRFWKHRVEAGDEPTFTVGVIYGPSGCGKSSLVKAGLLPRLAGHVLAVYVEATAGDTEARLLRRLRKRCPDLSADLDLTGALAALGQGQGVSQGQKVFLVIDQFEQWLHARRGEADSALAAALRQCDGEHVQCVVLVRDDFWMSLTRFLAGLGIDLLQGQNMAPVDLFDLIHARNVLAAFGRAFGRVDEPPSPEQQTFLDQAVQGLARDGRVISVHLALFAEMVKGKPWTLATWKSIGGLEGVGVSFLEETFQAGRLRLHQPAARGILKALLPKAGADIIKGHMRSEAELLQASGYASRPRDFEELIRILDSEVRLITPTEAEGPEESLSAACGLALPDAKPQAAEGGSSGRYYQLTHDYLVPSVREWLTRKQKETRRGRAELRLAERAALWNAKPENRHLPAAWEWANIRLLTRRKDWTGPQRRMMGKAARYHGVRGLLLVLLLALLGWGIYEGNGQFQAHALCEQLLEAEINGVPNIVAKMAPYRGWVDPLLSEAYQQAEADGDTRRQLKASLALLPVDDGQVAYLYRRLLDAAPQEIDVLVTALEPHKEALAGKLWTAAEQPAPGHSPQRLKAACALARYEPGSPRWAGVQDKVANDLVAVPAVHLAAWRDGLRPVAEKLRGPLVRIFRGSGRGETERSLAMDILAVYAADQPQLLAGLLLDADTKPFRVLLPIVKEKEELALPVLEAELDRKPAAGDKENDRVRLAKRKANAAVALVQLGHPERVWPLLQHSCDPTVRSYLIHRLGPLGAGPTVIGQFLKEKQEVSIQRALVLSLGSCMEEDFAPGEHSAVMQKLQEIYVEAPDPGLHGAVEWVLRHWHEDRWLEQVNDVWAKDREGREKQLKRLAKEFLAKELCGERKGGLTGTLPKSTEKTKPPALRQWYVNSKGQTMVVIPESKPFWMGSPPEETGQNKDEHLHKKRIERSFAIAAKPVTVAQFKQFFQKVYGSKYDYHTQFFPKEDCPAHVSFYLAAEYCNWLSEEEGILKEQWCYEQNSDRKYGHGMKLKANYLSLAGYRLPTEAEIEYACRAKAETSRYYGAGEELLANYGWYWNNADNQSHEVGRLKPNDLGLFDMHGNLWCWCQDRHKDYPKDHVGTPIPDIEDDKNLNILDGIGRVNRGGSFDTRAPHVRSANRSGSHPEDPSNYIGFRPAKTLTVE